MSRSFLIYSSTLFLIGFFIYAFALNGVLFFDDEHLIINNAYIYEFNLLNIKGWFTENAFAGAGRISEYYRPLLIFSFAINYAIGGLEPLGYHIINNLLHSINSVLVFYILNKYIFKKHWQAFLVALIFAIHPMQSEGVAYVSGRGDLLSSLFMLLGLVWWLKIFENRRRFLYGFLSCLMLVLALLSRENGVVFPFLLLVFYISFVSREKFFIALKKGLIKVIPHLTVVFIYLSLRLTVFNFRNFLNFGNYDTQSLYANSLLIRMYTFGSVLVEYMRTLFWPTNVHERFYFPVKSSFFDLSVWFSFLVLLFIIGIIIRMYRDDNKIKKLDKLKKEGYVSHFMIWFFGWGWFFVCLFPGSGIIPTNVIIQDHRLYLAMIGIFVILVFYLDKFFEYLNTNKYKFLKNTIILIVFFYLVFFSWVTVKRSIIWGNPIELFEETIRYEPEAVLAYNSLGKYYLVEGEYSKAEQNFLVAIKKNSNAPNPYYNLGEIKSLSNLEKDIDVAVWYYKRAIDVDPKFIPSHRALAVVYMGRGSREAVYYLKKLTELSPRDISAYYNLAKVLHLLNEKEEALYWLNKGLLLVNNIEARNQFLNLKEEIIK